MKPSLGTIKWTPSNKVSFVFNKYTPHNALVPLLGFFWNLLDTIHRIVLPYRKKGQRDMSTLSGVPRRTEGSRTRRVPTIVYYKKPSYPKQTPDVQPLESV